MKFFKSKKKTTIRDFRALPEDPTAALKKELDSAIVPSLKAKTSDETSEVTKKIKKAEPIVQAATDAPAIEPTEEVTTAPAETTTSSMTAEPVAEVPAISEVNTQLLDALEAEVSNMRLFPGFEDQKFEIGYAACASAKIGVTEQTPMLVMRWKLEDGNETAWFPVPPIFNKSILTRIHERDTDLDRLLLDYGYDSDQLCRPSTTDVK